MADEFDGEGERVSPQEVKKSKRSKTLFFSVALGAIFVLILAVGPVRSAAGDFLANVLGVAGRTFSPSEVYVGEIPLAQTKKSAKSESPTAIMHNSGVPAAKTAPSGKTAQAVSRDKEVQALNDKINSLQAQLSKISSTLPAISPVVPASSTSTQNQASAPGTQTTFQQIIPPNPTGTGRVLISEIMAGADGNSNYEFVELYNAGSAPADLTGWSVKKKSSTGSESSLVAASRLSGKIIQPGKYFLLGNENGYQGSVSLDVMWPSSYTLAYTNNSVVLYNGSGARVEEIFWAEIPKGQSFVRTDWNGSQFILSSSPSPQNSQSR